MSSEQRYKISHQNPTKGYVGFSWKNCHESPTLFLFLATNFFFEFFFNEKLAVKIFSNFFTVNVIEKNFEILSENSKKNFVAKNKKCVTGGKYGTIFPEKIRHDLSLGFDIPMRILL